MLSLTSRRIRAWTAELTLRRRSSQQGVVQVWWKAALTIWMTKIRMGMGQVKTSQSQRTIAVISKDELRCLKATMYQSSLSPWTNWTRTAPFKPLHPTSSPAYSTSSTRLSRNKDSRQETRLLNQSPHHINKVGKRHYRNNKTKSGSQKPHQLRDQLCCPRQSTTICSPSLNQPP